MTEGRKMEAVEKGQGRPEVMIYQTFGTQTCIYLGKVFHAKETFSAKGLRQKCIQQI